MQNTAAIQENLVFGLDIGTRSIVGVVGFQDRKGFHVVAMAQQEHETRAMLDGQIHDIYKVGDTIRKVKNDLEIKIPQSVLGIKKWECEVVSNNNVASFIKEFVVRLPEGETLNFQPGSYIQIDVPKYDIKFTDMDIDDKYRDEWDKFKMWGLVCKNDEETYRAYSMANHPAEGNIVLHLFA